jgi:MFS family permease
VVKRVGGPARARVITLFGAVLALNGADTATVGAVAPQLEHALHIGNTKIGLLSSVALLVGAVFTIPVGLLVDRVKRLPMLSISIVLWSIASLVSAFSSSYSGLLLTRLLLGAVTATAGPAIASLTGDYFPARERGRIYAYILGGEIAGTAVGFIRIARDSGLLPRTSAVSNGARAAPRRSEQARAGCGGPQAGCSGSCLAAAGSARGGRRTRL